MATDYPGALDTTKLTSPNTTDKTNSPSHAGLHANANDAIKAIEAKVGTGASTPVVSTLLFGTGTGTSAWQTLTSANLAAVLTDETGTGSAVFATTPTLVTPKMDTINESTPGNGTTVGGVNIKSGALTTANSVVATNIATSAVGRTKIDWSTFSLNIKSASNGSGITLNNNASQDLASNGLTLSFTCTGTAYALVTVSLGVSSTSDFEFGPEIRLAGTVVQKMQPSAAIGNASSRAVVRGFTYFVTLVNGSNTVSAGVTITSGTASAITASGATISALVLGNVTA